MTITANNSGRVKGKFKVPEKVKTGTKLVEFFGGGGSHGQFLFESKGEIWNENRQNVTVNTITTTTTTTDEVQGVSYVRLPAPAPAPVVYSAPSVSVPAMDNFQPAVPNYMWAEVSPADETAPASKPIVEPVAKAPSYNATVSVNNITADNTINYAESRASGNRAISGTATGDAKPGDKVTVQAGDLTYSTTVKADGTFSVSVPNRVLSNTDTAAQLAVSVSSPARGDVPAGSSTANKAFAVDSAAKAVLAIVPPTVPANATSKDKVTVTGTAGGDAKAGDKVSVVVGSTTYKATVASNGTFAVDVNAKTLAADKNGITAKVAVTDVAGNKATAAAVAPVVVTPPPPAPVKTTPVVTAKCTKGKDPLAQTFTLESSRQIAAVEIFITNPGTSPVIVSLRRTTSGVPIQAELASAKRQPATLTANTWQRFEFLEPAWLSAGEEYAIVVMADNADVAIGIAELKQWDAAGNRWVTGQPYTIGVLLSSSNASTWTAHQESDMAFRLLSPNYAVTTKTITLGEVYVHGATDLMLIAHARVPSADCRVNYYMTLPAPAGGVAPRIRVIPNDGVRLRDAVTGVVKVEAELIGSAVATPIVEPGAQLLTGQYCDTPENYISRGVTAGTNVKVVILFDAVIPDGASITPSFAAISDTDTWTAITDAPTVTPSINGWNEYRYQLTGFTGDMVHAKLKLAGLSGARPMAANLRVIVL